MKTFLTRFCFVALAIAAAIGALDTAERCGLDHSVDPEGYLDTIALVCGAILTSLIIGQAFKSSSAVKLISMASVAGLSRLKWPVIVIKSIGWIVVFPVVLVIAAVLIIPFAALILGSAISDRIKR
jgi:low temperature requirement protein LtrA